MTYGTRDCATPFPQSFTDQEIVSAPSTQLSWGPCMEILPNKDPLARDFCEMRHIERWDVPTQGGISTDILAIEPEAERLLDRLLLKGTPS